MRLAKSITATIPQTVRRPVAHTQAHSSSTNRANEGEVKAPAAVPSSAFHAGTGRFTAGGVRGWR